nr:MAG TPA: Putative tail fiber protein [Bacteriophage sp.]
MAETGILQRRQSKAYFEIPENKPVRGEIVYAMDTDEYGSLNKDGVTIDWVPHRGLVTSVAGKQQDVILNKADVGLDQVDNTADLDKPISNATKQWQDDHLAAVNPHNINKAQVGLGNVDNTSDLNKPISSATQEKLTELQNTKVDNTRVLTDVPANAKFTDTTYEVKDGELSEINFTEARRLKLDTIEASNFVLANPALSVQGRKITLTRGDGSVDTIETQDSTYNDSHIIQEIDKLKKSKVDNSRVLTDVPANAKFTDTVYNDTALRNDLFNAKDELNKKINDNKDSATQSLNNYKQEAQNKYLLKTEKAADSAKLNGKTLSSDYSTNDTESPASISAVYNLSNIVNTKLSRTDIKNDFTGGVDKALSAEKGKDLSIEINKIKEILKSDDVNLDTLQEIIVFIKKNKDKLGQSIGIDAIVGLRAALSDKLDKSSFTGPEIIKLLQGLGGEGSGINADKLDGFDSSDFNKTKGINQTQESAATSFVIDSIKLKDGVVTDLSLEPLTKDEVGLENVDNTSDLNKPISTATQTALDLKADCVVGDTTKAKKAQLADNSVLFNNEPDANFARAKTITNINQADKPGLYKIDSTNYSISGKSFTIDNIIAFSNNLRIHFLQPNAETLIENSGVFSEIKGSGSGSAETPQTILAKLLAVDGRGSNLDADLLGGVNYAQYALKSDYLDKTTVNNKFSDINTKLNGVAKVIYSQTEPTDKNAIWVRENPGLGDNIFVETVPVGSYVNYSSLNTIPDGFMVCDGRSLKKSEYPELFAVIGYTYGGYGEIFQIPLFNDGRFMRSIGGAAEGLGVLQKATRIPNLGIYRNNGIASITTPRADSYGDTNIQLSIENADDYNAGTPSTYFYAPLSSPTGSIKAGAQSSVRPKNSSVVVLIKVKNNIKFLNSGKVKISDNLDDLTAVTTVKAVKDYCDDYVNPNLLMNGNFCSFERQNNEFFDLQNMNNIDYLTDRWQVFSSVNDLKWTGGVYDDTKLMRSIGIRKLSGSANIQIVQFIENITNFNPLEYVTISFWARAEKNKNITVHLQPVKERFISSMLPVYKELNITNQTKFYSVTLQVPDFLQFIKNDTNFDRTKYILALKIDFGNEVNEPVFLQNIKLEKGTKATKFVNYGGSEFTDRQACLRYFERIRKRHHFITTSNPANLEYFVDVNFRVQKRSDTYKVDYDADPAAGIYKGDVPNGIYPATPIDVNRNRNRDGILFFTKIKNKVVYVDNITIDADF